MGIQYCDNFVRVSASSIVKAEGAAPSVVAALSAFEPFAGADASALPDGSWVWHSDRVDVVDLVISLSLQFPDIQWSVEGAVLDEVSVLETFTVFATDGYGTYSRTDLVHKNARIPVECIYGALTFESTISGGRSRLDAVYAHGPQLGSLEICDVTQFFRELQR